MQRKLSQGRCQRHGGLQRHQQLRHPRLAGMLDQCLAALGLLDLARAQQQVFEIAVFGDQLGGGLDANARHSRHVIDTVPGQRLHIDHLVRHDAEFLEHLVWPDALLLHRVQHIDAVADQLHQVLVGADDQHCRARLARQPGIGGDEIVRLVIRLLDTGNAEGAHRLADQRELRPQVGWRLGPLRLVLVVESIAECGGGMVHDNRQMGRLFPRHAFAHQFPHHVAEARHRADRQPVGLAGERRQRVIGAENIGRAIDKKEVAAGADAGRGLCHGVDHRCRRRAWLPRRRPKLARLPPRAGNPPARLSWNNHAASVTGLRSRVPVAAHLKCPQSCIGCV